MTYIPLIQSQIELGRTFVFKDSAQSNLFFYLPKNILYTDLAINQGTSYTSISGEGSLNLTKDELKLLKEHLVENSKIIPLHIYHNGNPPIISDEIDLENSNINISLINSLPFPSFQISIILLSQDNNDDNIKKIKDLWEENKLFKNDIEISYTGKNIDLDYSFEINLQEFITKLSNQLQTVSMDSIRKESINLIKNKLNDWSNDNVNNLYLDKLVLALRDKILAMIQINGQKTFNFDDGHSVIYIDKEIFSMDILSASNLKGKLVYSFIKDEYVKIKY